MTLDIPSVACKAFSAMDYRKALALDLSFQGVCYGTVRNTGVSHSFAESFGFYRNSLSSNAPTLVCKLEQCN